MRTLRAKALLLVLFLSFALVVVYLAHHRSGRLREKPNVILISIDALRADHLGSYGYNRNTSPNLDAFAMGAVQFDNAYASTCWTAPSHMTMFTSLYPSVHEVNQHPFPAALSADIKTLPQYLKEAGYSTHGIYYGHYVAPELGFGKGFDSYSEKDFIALANKEAFNVLDGRSDKDKPFFMFFHVGDVHQPYMDINEYTQKSPEERDMFDPGYKGSIVIGSESEALALSEKIWYHKDAKDLDRDIYHMAALYDGAIRHTDRYLGEFFKGLKDRGLYDNTLIIFTSDHGEEFGEHGILGHNQLFKELLHVPLIVKPPKSGGARYTETVRLVDLMPTVLDYIGIPFPTFHQGTPFSALIECTSHVGRIYGKYKFKAKSLYLLLKGEDRSEVYSESEMQAGPYTSHRSLLDPNYHFQRDILPVQPGNKPVRYRLYDMKKDLSENDEVASKFPETVSSYDNKINKLGKEMQAARPKVSKDTRRRNVKMRKEQIEWLKSVGYLH